MRKSPIRPRRFPGCRGAAIIALVFTAFAANAAYDYYWYGAAGDGLWTTPANWSTTRDSYTKAGDYPRSGSFNVHVDTGLSGDHRVEISVPASKTCKCGAFELYDSSGEGTLVLDGDFSGGSRLSLPLSDNNKTFVWTETGHPMHLELLNFSLPNGALNVSENECAGCSLLVSNCVYAVTGNNYYLKMPGKHGGTVTVLDSEITTQHLGGTSVADVAGYVLAVTNSTIAVKGSTCLGGPGAVVDFSGSTLSFGSAHPVFGANAIASTNAHPGMKIRFADSRISFNRKFLYAMSAGGELSFVNVVQAGECQGVEVAGLSATSLTNTALRFYNTQGNGYRGISGNLVLDNSEWVCTNASAATVLNGPLHVTLAGEAPRFGTSAFSGTHAVTFDFLVPKGGFAIPPVNRMDNSKTGTLFPTSAAGGSLNVLPESPAALAQGTVLCPLVYVRDSKGGAPVCELSNLPLSTLPNDRSKFLVTTDFSWNYDEIAAKSESDWTCVDPGYSGTVAGVAVRLVGRPSGTLILVR